ncbi:MAG TPA: MBL fold metallo-hydrolase [Candidatus Ozemobacteraceae bacterium]|nr:MBL fold metallo-hydrolase [Candidatus Ozemobacteraceae bacterium]
MNITFHGAVGCVTGSCYQVQCGETNFLVDCGMFQGSKTLKEYNYRDFPFDPAKLSFVLVTHAHIDHTGMLPKLVKKGFNGKIYGLDPTVDLLRFMLPDSAKIQEMEVEQKNRRNARKGVEPLVPVYSMEDAEKTLRLLYGVSENLPVNPGPGVRVTYRNAGHVLGSSFIEVELTEAGKTRRVTFGGDLGGKGHPIIKDPETPTETDILLIESTYGDRLHQEDSKESRLEKLAQVVQATIKRRGNVVIPSFALERTQDLLFDLLTLMDQKRLPQIPVVIDSPLASESTKIFAKYPEYYDEETTELLKKQGNLFDHPNFRFTKSVEESMQLNQAERTIILSSSGMCDAGRIKHHLKHQLWKKANTILFVGYQAEGTLGRLLLDGAKTVRIHGDEVRVEAKIDRISGYSGHADQRELLEWLKGVTVRDRVFVIHGEDEARAEFARLVSERLQLRAVIPQMGQSFDLLVEAKEPVAAPVVKHPEPVTARIDSYNLYAQLMLKTAEFMRRTSDEEQRRQALEQMLKLVS